MKTQSRILNELRKRMKFIKTLNLYLCFFIFGLVSSISGPCLLDLQHLVRTDAQHIAMIYTAKSSGYLPGAIIAGIILDLVRSKVAVLMICNIFITITMFGIPWSKNLEILMAFMCINGFCLGAIETGGNVMCLELWGKDSNAVFQGLHLAFSLGGLLSPLIAAPFLENITELSHIMDDMDNTTFLDENLVDTSANISDVLANISHFPEDRPKLIYPFSIIGAVTLLSTIFNLGVFLISPTENESLKDASRPDNSKRSFLFMFFTVIFTFLVFVVISGTETGYAQTVTIFSVKGKLHLTTTRGSYITSALWAAFTLSRLLCMFLAMKFSSLNLLIGDICLLTVAAMVLLFLMPNEWALWLASVTLGIGIASAYGVVIGWINTYIHISNKFAATFTVGGATGDIVVPFIITYFIDTDPELFRYVPAASAILMTVLISLLFCMFKNGSRVKTSKNVVCSVVDDTEAKN